MADATQIEQLVARRDRARDRFATLGDLRPGALSENFRKCGKPNCHCAREGDAGHGPSYVLTRSVGGRTRSVRVRADEVDATRALVEEYQRFRDLSSEFLEASEALAAARSKAHRQQAGKPPKRGRSSPRSRRRSRSKRTA